MLIGEIDHLAQQNQKFVMNIKIIAALAVLSLFLVSFAEVTLAQVCFGRSSGDPEVCHGNGDCVANDVCSCQCYFGGPQCNQIQCFGLNSGNRNVCSGNGSCVAPNRCICEAPFHGRNCQLTGVPIPVCFNFPANDPRVCSGNGVCVSPNNCECDPGFFGFACQYR